MRSPEVRRPGSGGADRRSAPLPRATEHRPRRGRKSEPPRSGFSLPEDLSPLFRAKTQPPQLPEVLLGRPRLMNALRQACRRRVVMVRGPGGAGKTTLLARLAETLSEPPAWYTVDDLDRDALAFLCGLSLALGCPPTERPADGPLAQLARVVAALERRSPRALLVVDDVHRLDDPGAIHSLADLIRYLPRGATLILSERQTPELLVPALDWCAARQQLTTLTWDDLRLSEEERQTAADLFHKAGTGSWIFAWSADTEGDVKRHLRREIVEGLPKDQVRLLSQLSVLPSFDATLAATIAGDFTGDVRRQLDDIARDTPILDRTHDGAFRFGEAAREILGEVLRPGERVTAQRMAGLALRESDPLRSAESFAEAGDWAEVARSLAQVPLLDWFRQTITSAHELLRRVPSTAMIGYPQLVLARAWAQISWQQEPREALALLADDHGALTLNVSPSTSVWRHYLRARGHLALGETAVVEREAASLRRATTILRRDPRADPRMVARCLCSLAIVERALGDSRAAIEAAEQGLALGELSQTTTREEQLVLLHVLANISYLDGDYERAQERLTAALKLAQGPDESAQRVMFLHLQAGIAQGRGEYTRALGLLEQALAEPILPLREKAMLTLQTAHILLDLEDFKGAGQRYRMVASWFRAPDRDWCFSRSLAGLAICCSLLGLLDEAATTIAQLRGYASGAPGYDLALARGIFALRREDFPTAAEQFNVAAAANGTLGGRRDAWLATLLQAQAYLRQGREEEAHRLIQEHRRRLDGLPIPAVPGWVVEPVEGLLGSVARSPGDVVTPAAKASPRDLPSSRLRHAIATVDHAALGGVGEVELHLFGPPRLVVDGKDVAWPVGLRRKSVELFWYSALHRDGFTRDQALVDLFPEYDQKRGYGLVSVAISDLRRALTDIFHVAGDRVLRRLNRRVFALCLDGVAAAIRVDTLDLSVLSDELRTSRRAAPPASLPELFRGELVAGLTAEWIEPIRRYWATVYLRTLTTLAARYAKHGELQQAIRCHELALALDPTLGSSHAHLMRLFHAAGDHQALEAQMWLYRRVASEDLGARPDLAVQNLYDSLSAAPS